jgi:hypothetical protein
MVIASRSPPTFYDIGQALEHVIWMPDSIHHR